MEFTEKMLGEDTYVQKKSRLKLTVNLAFWLLFALVALREDQVVRKESSFDLFLINTLAPIQNGISSLHNYVTSTMDEYLDNVDAKKELASLNLQYSELQSKYFSIEQSVERVRRQNILIERYGTQSSNPVLARVIASDASSDYRMVRLNKGLNDGVRIQSPVVTHKGLVGYVYRLSENFSDVLTILDSKTKVDGQVKRTKSLGIVEGSLGDFCSMKYLLRRDPILLNDLVVTSGLGNIFPEGIPIGLVTKIDKQSHGVSQKVLIRPLVPFGKLTDVLILSRKFSEDEIVELKKLDKQ